MSHPDDEALADLALERHEPPSSPAAAHVRDCPRCADEVAAYRGVATAVAAVGPGESTWHTPPAAVWDRVCAAVADETTGTDDPGDEPAWAGLRGIRHDDTERRGTDNYDADKRNADEHGADERDPASRGRRAWRHVAPWAAGAAAAGIAIGLFGGRLWWGAEQPAPAPSPVTLMSTPLQTVDTRQRLGEAKVVQAADSVDLAVDTGALDPAGGYLEVWLINMDGKRMVSVGVLDPAVPRAIFPVSRELMDQGYLVVDVSREGFDDKPQHSGDSLVRGTLST